MRSFLSTFMICISVLVVGCSSSHSETLCFSSRKEAAIQNPQKQIFYTTVGKHQDHQDLKKAGPIGSKCWHAHKDWTPLNLMPTHLPKKDNYLSSQEYFWPLGPEEKTDVHHRF